jgi:DNA-binding transcriptional LysR family regulator
MIPLEALQALDSIDRKGSFAAAAEELHRVPSAITYTIKKLEEQLNIKLFDRDKQRARLTPTGKLVLEKGREILFRVQQLEDQAQQAENGWEKQLRIVIDTILPCEPFWPLIKELQDTHPWLDIKVMDEALSGSWEALTSDRADLIIGVSGDEPAGGHWQRTCLGNLSMHLYCSPAHPAHQLRTPIQHEALSDYTHIIISDSARYLPQRHIGLLGIQQTLIVSNLHQKLSALEHGMGISHLPLAIAKPLVQQGKLIPLDTGKPAIPNPFFMCWKKNNHGKANEWLRHQIVEQQVLAHLLNSIPAKT